MIYTANESFNLLLQGLTPQEIKIKLNLTDNDWVHLMSSHRFSELLRSAKSVPDLIKIKEIEDNLFGLLEGPRTINVNKRITALTKRYASFVLCQG